MMEYPNTTAPSPLPSPGGRGDGTDTLDALTTEALQSVERPPRPPRPQRYCLTVAYDGFAFSGWQKQKDTSTTPSSTGWRRTVQGVLEEAVGVALQQPVNVVGASRTDAGVHALGQTVMFDALTRIPLNRLAQAINARLPEDVEVRDARLAVRHFNVIGDAQSKQYRYHIYNASPRPLHRRRYAYHCWWKIDIEKMNQAAACLLGTHDFTAFAGAGSPRQSNVRTIHHCHVSRDVRHDEIQIVVAANGFLYNMVRILAGTLLEVGRGAMPVEQITRALAERDRRLAGPTLPPQGLWLEWIRYPENSWIMDK